MGRIDKVLLNISELRRVLVDPSDVYFLEAVGEYTLVCLRSNRRLRDSRCLGALIKQFGPYGFLRSHRNHAVNLARIQEIRRRKSREDWEVKLEPPVNRLLPVSRNQIGKLLRAFGAGKGRTSQGSVHRGGHRNRCASTESPATAREYIPGRGAEVGSAMV